MVNFEGTSAINSRLKRFVRCQCDGLEMKIKKSRWQQPVGGGRFQGMVLLTNETL